MRGPLWEHMFVTSQGHPYARFRYALATGNARIAEARRSPPLEHLPLPHTESKKTPGFGERIVSVTALLSFHYHDQ